jgi:hypothetical protein
MRKTKTVNLQYKPSSLTNRVYTVEKVTESVELVPGDTLTKEDVQKLCDRIDWKVTIVGK